MNIRSEESGDEDAIDRVTEAAFAAVSHSNHAEALIVRALRDAGDLTVSLVADVDGEIVAHIAFSPVAIGGRYDGWFGLGPLSVQPDKQRDGIGSALVLQGLAQLRARGAKGCALLGHPDFYRRLGFRSDSGLHYGDLPAHLIQHLVFDGASPSGELIYTPAFDLAG